jgi:uncharacterized protein YggE
MRRSPFVHALVALSFVASPVFAHGEPAPDGGDSMSDPAPMVTVRGHGEVRVDPDEATVRLGVVAESESAGEAQQRANLVVTGALEALGDLDVAAQDIQTGSLRLDPVYDNRRRPDELQSEPRISGYRASNQLIVRLDDLAKIGPVVDAAIEAGANNVDGIEFSVRDDRAARQEALTRAVAEARAKAEAIAAALGRSLGEVVHVQEGGVSLSPPMPTRGYARAEMMAMDVAGTPVSPGQATVAADVTIAYSLGGSSR